MTVPQNLVKAGTVRILVYNTREGRRLVNVIVRNIVRKKYAA